MDEREYIELLGHLAQTPRQIAALVNTLSAQALLHKPAPDAFCALEQVCHLRDIEREGYCVRIRRIVEENHPVLQNIDGSLLAIERNYPSQDLAAALADFAAARADSVRRLREATAPERTRTGRFAGAGDINLCDLAAMMREHDREHLSELGAIRSDLQR